MCVDLSGTDVGMSEQFLDRPDVGHTHELRGERMPEHVGVDRPSECFPSGFFDYAFDLPRRERPECAQRVESDRFGFSNEVVSKCPSVFKQGVRQPCRDRYLPASPFFGDLRPNHYGRDRFGVVVKVPELKLYDLADTKSGLDHQTCDGIVADPPGELALRALLTNQGV